MVSAISLLVGAWVATRFTPSPRAIGVIMGFGAGTLLGAIAYDLLPDTVLESNPIQAVLVAFAVLGVGCAVFYWAESRYSVEAGEEPGKTKAEVGRSITIGALLDGIPESMVIGITVATGGLVSIAFLVAVFVSNIPESLTATSGLRRSGMPDRKIYRMWVAIVVLCTASSIFGFLLIGAIPTATGLLVKAFNAGAVLAMVASTMLPEGVREAGRTSVLMVVLGFALAALLSIPQ